MKVGFFMNEINIEDLKKEILNNLIGKMKNHIITIEEETCLVRILGNEKIFDDTLEVFVSGIQQAKNKNFKPLFDDIGQIVAIDFADEKVYKGETIIVRYISK
jgi:hypothetical protein